MQLSRTWGLWRAFKPISIQTDPPNTAVSKANWTQTGRVGKHFFLKREKKAQWQTWLVLSCPKPPPSVNMTAVLSNHDFLCRERGFLCWEGAEVTSSLTSLRLVPQKGQKLNTTFCLQAVLQFTVEGLYFLTPKKLLFDRKNEKVTPVLVFNMILMMLFTKQFCNLVLL